MTVRLVAALAVVVGWASSAVLGQPPTVGPLTRGSEEGADRTQVEQVVYEAEAGFRKEELERIGGQVVDDAEASGGRALQLTPTKHVPRDEHEGANFGIPGGGPVGEVDVTVRMKASSVAAEDTVFYIGIFYTDKHAWPLVRKLVTPSDFGKADAYRDFKLRCFRKSGREFHVRLAWHVLGATKITVDTVKISATGKSLGVGNLRPDRLWYRRGDTATVTADVANRTGAPQGATLAANLVGDLEVQRPVYSSRLSLAPREEREVSFSFSVGHVEWGHEVRVTLVQEHKPICSASEIITVADNPYKTCVAYGSVMHSRRFTRADGYAREWVIPPLRHNCVSVVEVFSWAPGQAFDMTPEAEYWLSGQGTYREGKRGLKEFIEQCHEQGIAVVSYAQDTFHGPAGFDVARKHPEWILFEPNGWPAGGFNLEMMERQRNPDPADRTWAGTFAMGAILDRSMECIDYVTNELIGAARMFGFDGVRWDGNPMTSTSRRLADGTEVTWGYGHDGPGKVKDPDETSARITRRMKERILKELPHFCFGYNAELSGQGYSPEAMPKMWKVMAADAYLLNEYLTNRGWPGNDPKNLWTKVARDVVESVDRAKPLGGYHFAGPYTGSGSHVTYSHLIAMNYAASSRVWATSRPEYARFALRHAELLFSNALRRSRQPRTLVRVDSPKPVWWEDYVYTWMPNPEMSRTVVHLLNPPVVSHYSGDATAPAEQEKVVVSGAPPSTEAKCDRAWILSADFEPWCLPVEPTFSAGHYAVVLPKLRYWSTVVFEWKRL